MKRAKFKLVSPLQHAILYKCQDISLICCNDKNKREYINYRYFIIVIIIIAVIILSLSFLFIYYCNIENYI